MTAPVAKLGKPTEISQEAAYDIVNSFDSGAERFEFPALVVVTGESQVYGMLHVIFPPIGNAILLPIVSQS